MDYYPILFSVKDPVIGNGFVAGVAVNGRALMRSEDDGFWVDGVFPGAVGAGGATRDEALFRFRESYRSVLYDMALTASTFEEFRDEVCRFFWEETAGEADAWKEAAAKLRTDPKQAGDWLRVRTEYPEPDITVVQLDQDLRAEKNPDDRLELAGTGERRAA